MQELSCRCFASCLLPTLLSYLSCNFSPIHIFFDSVSLLHPMLIPQYICYFLFLRLFLFPILQLPILVFSLWLSRQHSNSYRHIASFSIFFLNLFPLSGRIVDRATHPLLSLSSILSLFYYFSLRGIPKPLTSSITLSSRFFLLCWLFFSTPHSLSFHVLFSPFSVPFRLVILLHH